VKRHQSVVCVGIDPDVDRILQIPRFRGHDPVDAVLDFSLKLIELTSPFCMGYKPNLAFFEALGSTGWKALEQIIHAIPQEKIIIADAKRGDIGNTARHYKKAFFDHLEVDAITLNPLMGWETLEPFLEDESKAVYALALTSNPGADDLFNKTLSESDGGKTVAQFIASELSKLQQQSHGHLGMVTGATRAEQITSVVREFTGTSLLIPGIGAQGGSVEELKSALAKSQCLPIISISRGISYASTGQDWEKQIVEAVKSYTSQTEPLIYHYVEA
jgi:orotidine-5'-phosphate decarboxylase